MSKYLLIALIAGSFSFATPQIADGQLIRIFDNAGNVDVRVPFVRVRTDPSGASQVRAPFVRINSPPPTYYPVGPFGRRFSNRMAPRNVNPAPTNANPAPTNANPAASIQPSTTGQNGAIPLTPPTDVSAESTRNSIPPNPNGLKSVLAEEESRPLTTAQRLGFLAGDYESFEQQLVRFSNADVWQEYLQLPNVVFDEHDDATPVITEQDIEALQESLARYDRASSRADSRSLTSLSGFRTTHENLRALVEQLTKKATDEPEKPPAPK